MIKQFDHDLFIITAYITDFNKVTLLPSGDVRSTGFVDVFVKLGVTVLSKCSIPFDVDTGDMEQIFEVVRRSHLPSLIKEATSKVCTELDHVYYFIRN